jgi:hypothetical protein
MTTYKLLIIKYTGTHTKGVAVFSKQFDNRVRLETVIRQLRGLFKGVLS